MMVDVFNEGWRRLTALLKRHASLGLLGLTSASYFVAMIVARKTLEPDDLYFWNVLVTLVAMGFSLCFFGAEQLFLRFSTVTGVRVAINRGTLLLMGGALVLFTFLLAILSEGYFFRLDMLALYPVLGLCVGVFVFVYNVMRVRKSFITAQLAANGWKFTILGALLLAPFGNASLLVTVAGLGLACAGTLALFWRNRAALDVTIDPMPTQWQTLFFGFLLSLLVLMLLNNADRLIMARHGSEAMFSEYVYLVTLLLLPFSLLSNYVGFKEMAYLKHTYDRRRFLRKTLGVGGLAAGLFIPWFGLIYALQGLLEVPVHPAYALPCLIIVTCRCSYALLSALIALHAGVAQIHLSNIMMLFFVAVLSALVMIWGVDILRLLFMLSLFWLARFGIFLFVASNLKIQQAP